MDRKLIPLTDEIKNSSLVNVKTWESLKENEKASTSAQLKSDDNSCADDDNLDKVKDIITKLNQKSSGKFDVFVTKSVHSAKISKEKILQWETRENLVKIEDEKTNEEKLIDPKCRKIPIKQRQTIETQKQIAREAEKNALERCREGNLSLDAKNATSIDYSNDRNISIETLAADQKPQPVSRSPSAILPNIPTRRMLNMIKPRMGIKIKDEVKKDEKCKKVSYDPREVQKSLDGKQLKLFKVGEKLFVKLDENENNENVANARSLNLRTCRPKIHINNPNYTILTSRIKKIPKLNDLSLGKPYGVQLGLRNLHNEKTTDLKDVHAIDVILVAHRMTCIKHPANWNERDIDTILAIGAELYRNTKDVYIDKLNVFTKGFTCGKKFVQTTCSEPIVVGKVMTMGERSMDLYNGLHKFFGSYRSGLFVSNKLDLLIASENEGFFVFDPRGRNEQCERKNRRESALMAFTSINNLYHLIVNLSGLSSHAPFKICTLKVTRLANKSNELEEFTSQMGNPNVKCRSEDYQIINDHIACLRGSISLNSAVFGSLRNRHGLTSSIMAMVYAKIDPPASWCQATLDRVMHFGYQMHLDCLNGGVIRNLALPEIPSKFYVGDSYLTQICIVPYIHRQDVQETRVISDNPIAEIIIDAFNSFRYLLLEVDNYTFALWRSEDSKNYYLFDGYQKTLEGLLDTCIGTSFLFMANLIDFICEVTINRLTKASEGSLKIHGMKVNYLRKLSKNEKKNKKIFKLANMKCIRPFSANDVEMIQDAPSTVDSLAPLLTKSQLQILSIKPEEKPLHLRITDLNSPSLVCCKKLAYHEIMASVENKLSAIKSPQIKSETLQLMHQVHSEILKKITGEDHNKLKDCREAALRKQKSAESIKAWIKNPKTNRWTPCGEYIGTAEKVLIKTDLDCLKKERQDILITDEIPDEEMDSKCYRMQHRESEAREISHFHRLPDGTRIISGTKSLFKLPLDPHIYDFENLSVLVAVAAIVTSTKYKISTWSSETIDYVLGCGEIMSNVVELKHRMDFYTHNEHILPKIHINEKFYELSMSAVVNGSFKWLENYLKKVFEAFDRFLIVTSHGSIAVFQYNENFYLFEYATCNRVGYRIKNDDFGSSCLLSFKDIHSMVRRINANHSDVQEEAKFLIYRVIVKELICICDPEKDSEEISSYIPFTPSKENLIIDNIRHNRLAKGNELSRRLKEVNEKIKEEQERIKKYREETGEEQSEGLSRESLRDFDEKKFDYEFDIDAPTLSNQIPPLHSSWIKLDTLGYKLEEGEEISRIKGSYGYENRMFYDENLFKRCHFASIYAIMYAVHHPFETMNYRSVDVILENGSKIYDSLVIEDYKKHMTLKGVVVDQMAYELMLSEYENTKKFKFPQEMLNDFLTQQKYGILLGENCCMAIVKERNSSTFHIFDPYDMSDDGSQEEIQSTIGSWLRFTSLIKTLDYFASRNVKINEDDTKIEFKIYQVGILSHKAIKNQKAGYFLFNTAPPGVSSNACEFVDQTDDEKIEWITKTKTIPWSRLEKVNAEGCERYTMISKWKEYDVEMSRKLFSLWGNIHPAMKHFKPYSGKQHLTCCTVAILMSHIIKIDEWSAVLLDSIVTYGHAFLKEILEGNPDIKEITMDDLSGVCSIEGFSYKVDLQLEIFGQLYEDNRLQFNLNRALDYVFRDKKFSGVVLVCGNRSLAIGNHQNKTFFMYDCQSQGKPLFKSSQGTTYVLKCCCMKVLLACIILTLNVKQHGVNFYLYSVQVKEVDENDVKRSSKKFDEGSVESSSAQKPNEKASKGFFSFWR